MTNRYDLHCHSVYSDGSLLPQEVVALAKDKQLSGISLTDHDTFSGYFDIQNCGLTVIPGIELSCEFEQKSIHVLGYSFDPGSCDFQQFCLNQRIWRRERLVKMCQLLSQSGTEIDANEVMKNPDPSYTYGRVHIALELMRKGYIKTVGDAFKRYIGDRSPCYVPGRRCSVQEAIDAIHKAGGFAVLAHPHLIDSKSLVRRLLALNFDGIEAYYGRFTQQQNDHWAHRAKEKGMFVTGGSDFHGLPKPDSHLGCALCPEDTFQKLLHHAS